MAEINIGSLSGGGGGGGGGTWLKPEMESPANVEITSNQYLRFYKNPVTGAYLELNMSGSIPTARIVDSNGNITTIDGNSLDFNSAFDPSNPAIGNYLPAQVLIKTFDGGNPAGLYFICLDLNHNLAATLNLIRGTYGGTTGSSGPVEEGMLLGEIAFWGQDDPGIINPGQTNDINKPSRISVYATEDYTTGARGSEMAIYNTEAGTTTQRGNFRFLGTGQNRMELYGVGNFENNNPAYFAGVDAVGNIIEIAPAAVGPAIGATWLKPEMEGGNDVEISTENYLEMSFSSGDRAGNFYIAPDEYSFQLEDNETASYRFSQVSLASDGGIDMQASIGDERSLIYIDYQSTRVRAENTLTGTGGYFSLSQTEMNFAEVDQSIPVTGLNPVFTALATGQIIANRYGTGLYAGTPTYNISVDASGNLIETTISVAPNIYNTSDALTGNRQISGDGFSLNIFNTSTFQIEDVTNVLNLEVTPTDVSFFDGAFNYSSANVLETDAVEIDAPNAGVVDLGGRLIFSTTGPVRLSGALGSGFNVLRLMDTFTPSGTADANGAVGALAWDDDYIYMKTSVGWKRSALTTF